MMLPCTLRRCGSANYEQNTNYLHLLIIIKQNLCTIDVMYKCGRENCVNQKNNIIKSIAQKTLPLYYKETPKVPHIIIGILDLISNIYTTKYETKDMFAFV